MHISGIKNDSTTTVLIFKLDNSYFDLIMLVVFSSYPDLRTLDNDTKDENTLISSKSSSYFRAGT